jgi:hypothetical protein
MNPTGNKSMRNANAFKPSRETPRCKNGMEVVAAPHGFPMRAKIHKIPTTLKSL